MYLQVVVIDFSHFATEPCCDFVTIYDGYNMKSPLIVSLSGTFSTPPTGYTSSQQHMYVRFTTDASINAPGFSATFKSISSSKIN